MMRLLVNMLIMLCAGIGTARAVEPFIPTDQNSWAFPADCPDPAAPSPIDVRYLNEPVAGANGPLTPSADGHSLVRADGKPFRAWMVHMPHGGDNAFTTDAWSMDDYRRSARFLARLGVNLGVIGAIDPGAKDDAKRVNPQVMSYIHKSVAAAREQGMYTQLRVAWFHGITGAQLGIAGHEEKDLQCLVQYHPRAQEVWKSWVRQMLTTTNPHTGLALKDDPALCSLEIANEDSLLFYVTDGIQGEARAELERQFHSWCVDEYGSAGAALAAWDGFAHEAARPADGRLGIMIMWMLTRDGRGRANEHRVRDQLRFLVETSREWNREAKRFVAEELGADHLLVAASNFVPADRVLLDDALRLLAWRDMDLIENNHYFGNGGKPAIAGWRADAGGFLGLRSALDYPLGLAICKRPVRGKPFLVTEVLWPRPHPYEVEGPLLIAAYQTMNGIEGLAWAGPRDITWERRDRVYFPWWNVEGSMPMRPFSCAGPATLGQFPAAAAIRRIGLVRAAPTVVAEARIESDSIALTEQATAEEFAFDPTQFGRGASQDTTAAGGVPKEAYLVGRVEVRLADEQAPTDVADLGPHMRAGAVTSATGELCMDAKRRLFTVDAPSAQCAVGFLAEAGEVTLSHAVIRSGNPHGAIAIVALDGEPITASRRILVQAAMRSVPTGWRESAANWEENGQRHEGLRIDATGQLPWRVQHNDVTGVLPESVATRATALDGNGIPGRAVPLQREGSRVTLRMPSDAMYVVLE